MTDEERRQLQRRMDLANVELEAACDERTIVRLEEGERLGGLVGPCWALACKTCRGDVHDGPCPGRPAPKRAPKGKGRRA